jgi:glycosyltransferase involved in cell wall biosynthesis
VIPNFTIPNKITVTPRSLRANLTIGAMGRLVSVKGFDILISAISHLQSVGLNLDLLIAGSGPEEENLRRISNEMGVSTKFLGWLKDHEKSDFLNSLDIFVCPSREEPFGFVFLEAMEFSLPIVTTNTIGAHEIFKNHAGALISEIDNPISMAKNIQILLSNKSLILKMGKANRQAYLENFSIGSGTQKLAEVMEAVKKNVM